MKTALLLTLGLLSAGSAPGFGRETDTPQAAAAVPDGPAPTETEYRLVAGDKLRIEVYKEPQLSQSLEIRPDGKITLPLIGDINAAGSTSRELSTAIAERLREYVTTPVVTVIVAEATPLMIFVMGEVTTPRAQPVRGPVTVLQALAIAGGFKEFANTRRIRILRKNASGTIDTYTFNYRNAVERADRPTMLQPGDIVVVP